MANPRVSQTAIEVLADASSKVRVSQSVIEVLAGPVTPMRVSQSAIEVLVPNYQTGGGGTSGTNPTAASLVTTTPQAFGVLDEVDDGTIVEAFGEVEGGPFADPSTYFGGFKERRILSFGAITRKATTPGGGIQGASRQVVFDDTDRYFRASWGTTQRRGRKWSDYLVDHVDRLNAVQPYRVGAGLVTDYAPLGDFQYGLTVEGMLSRHISRLQSEVKVPPNRLTATELPFMDARYRDGWSPPIGYGLLEDESATAPQGVVPGIFVGTTNLQDIFGGGAFNVVVDWFIFFGHAVQDTLNLYVTPAAWTSSTAYLVGDRIRPNLASNGYLYQCVTAGTSGGSAPTFSTTIGATFGDGSVTWKNIGVDDPTLRYVVPSSAFGQILIDPHKPGWSTATGTTAKYVDYNGYRYHAVAVLNSHRFAKALREGRMTMSGNFRGIEDVGNATGALIDAPSRIVQHFWTNFVENTYKTGAWFGVPTFGAYSLFDTTTIEAVKTYTDTLVSGGAVKAAHLIGQNGQQMTLFEAVKQMASSWDLKLAENRHGQIILTIDNPAAAAAVTLTDQHDALSITSTLQRSGYANVVRYRYGYRYVPPVATQLEGEQGQPMPAKSVHEHADWVSGLQTVKNTTAITQNNGREEYLDLDLYGVRDQATADVLAARVLARAVGPSSVLEGPVGVRISTGLQGLQQGSTQIDIGTVIGLDHVEGLGATGYVGAKVIVDQVDVDLDGLTVTLSGLLQA
jgi:hypothetical protein